MKLSARNVTLTTSIAMEGAHELDLKPGANASRVIKASDVMVGVP